MDEGNTPANTPDATPPPLPASTPPPPLPPPPPPGQPRQYPRQDGMAQGGQFTVGAVLKKSLSMLFKNPILFFGLTILAAIPGLLGELLTDGEGAELSSAGFTLIGVFLGVIIQGAIAYGVYCTLKGEWAGFGDAIRRGTAHFLPLLGAAIIIGLGVGIGSMLLVVPGLILACIWAVAIPACVVEKLGVFDCLKRSAELTRGYRWQIFGLLALLFLISLGLGLIIAFVFGAIGSPLLVALGAGIIAIVPSAFQNVMTSTIYYDLRAVKEGVTVDSLANVFD